MRRDAANTFRRDVTDRLGTTDRRELVCPRAKSDVTPCVMRDGGLATADDGVCVGCGADPLELLGQELERREGR